MLELQRRADAEYQAELDSAKAEARKKEQIKKLSGQRKREAEERQRMRELEEAKEEARKKAVTDQRTQQTVARREKELRAIFYRCDLAGTGFITTDLMSKITQSSYDGGEGGILDVTGFVLFFMQAWRAGMRDMPAAEYKLCVNELKSVSEKVLKMEEERREREKRKKAQPDISQYTVPGGLSPSRGPMPHSPSPQRSRRRPASATSPSANQHWSRSPSPDGSYRMSQSPTSIKGALWTVGVETSLEDIDDLEAKLLERDVQKALRSPESKIAISAPPPLKGSPVSEEVKARRMAELKKQVEDEKQAEIDEAVKERMKKEQRKKLSADRKMDSEARQRLRIQEQIAKNAEDSYKHEIKKRQQKERDAEVAARREEKLEQLYDTFNSSAKSTVSGMMHMRSENVTKNKFVTFFMSTWKKGMRHMDSATFNDALNELRDETDKAASKRSPTKTVKFNRQAKDPAQDSIAVEKRDLLTDKQAPTLEEREDKIEEEKKQHKITQDLRRAEVHHELIKEIHAEKPSKKSEKALKEAEKSIEKAESKLKSKSLSPQKRLPPNEARDVASSRLNETEAKKIARFVDTNFLESGVGLLKKEREREREREKIRMHKKAVEDRGSHYQELAKEVRAQNEDEEGPSSPKSIKSALWVVGLETTEDSVNTLEMKLAKRASSRQIGKGK